MSAASSRTGGAEMHHLEKEVWRRKPHSPSPQERPTTTPSHKAVLTQMAVAKPPMLAPGRTETNAVGNRRAPEPIHQVILSLQPGRRQQIFADNPKILEQITTASKKLAMLPIHPWCAEVFPERTQKEHRQMLSYLFEFAEGAANLTPRTVLDYLYIRHNVPMRKKEGTLKWSTTSRNMGCAIGACRIANIYFPSVQNMDLMKDVEFALSRKFIARMAVEEEVDFPTAAVLTDLETAIKNLASDRLYEAAVFLALAWICASRLGCVAQLLVRNIKTLPSSETSPMAIQFTQGKTVRIVGQPYTIHPATGRFYKLVAPFLARATTRPKDERIFSSGTQAIATAALKAVQPTLEARSVRRGALQAMADAGVSDSVLLSFSRHTNLEMLHRYLAWGLHGLQRANAEAEASLKIAGCNVGKEFRGSQ